VTSSHCLAIFDQDSFQCMFCPKERYTYALILCTSTTNKLQVFDLGLLYCRVSEFKCSNSTDMYTPYLKNGQLITMPLLQLTYHSYSSVIMTNKTPGGMKKYCKYTKAESWLPESVFLIFLHKGEFKIGFHTNS